MHRVRAAGETELQVGGPWSGERAQLKTGMEYRTLRYRRAGTVRRSVTNELSSRRIRRHLLDLTLVKDDFITNLINGLYSCTRANLDALDVIL